MLKWSWFMYSHMLYLLRRQQVVVLSTRLQSLPIKFYPVREITFLKVRLISKERTGCMDIDWQKTFFLNANLLFLTFCSG